jgi:hypothetical protein
MRNRHRILISALQGKEQTTIYPMGTGGSFPGGKVGLGLDADHSAQSNAEVKNEYELHPPLDDCMA